MNFERFISRVSSRRVQSPIRATTKIAQDNPHFINMASGLPNPSMFPFTSAIISTMDGRDIKLQGSDMKKALQYSSTQGVPSLLGFIHQIHNHFHNPKIMKMKCETSSFDAIVTTGSQDGLSKVFEMLLNPGDAILVDNPCYSGTLAAIRPLGCNLLPIETDAYGIVPNSLATEMGKYSRDDSNIPKVLYTIPNGSNPTGASTTLERKQQVLNIAKKYNLVIIEDDPYYFLQFDSKAPSYQSLDDEGRVIRSDSLSKILSSGMRLGWITGSKYFINRLILHQQASSLHTSTMTQMMASELFELWGVDGFISHVEKVENFYRSQRDLMAKALETHLTGLAEWSEPKAGMFFWIKLNNVTDTTDLITNKAFKKEVIMLPGNVFEVDETKTDSSYIRASFSVTSEQDMNTAFSRLAELLR